MIKVLKKELLIYIVILVSLSLYMHPERIKMVESPWQLLHAFAWSFGAYLIVAAIRIVAGFILKLFVKNK